MSSTEWLCRAQWQAEDDCVGAPAHSGCGGGTGCVESTVSSTEWLCKKYSGKQRVVVQEALWQAGGGCGGGTVSSTEWLCRGHSGR